MTTRIELSGGFRLLRDGATVTVAYQRARALLAYLALEPGRHTRERLADLLWPHESHDAGRENLRRMLSVLREALGPERAALAADRVAVSLALGDRLTCDASEILVPSASCCGLCDPVRRTLGLADAERLVDGYRGPLLADLDLSDAPDFSYWLDLRRENLTRRAMVRLEQLATCLEKSGDRAGALLRLHQLVDLDPANETAHMRAMTLLAEDGRPAEALAQYETLRRHLADELGSAPGPACTELAAAIEASRTSDADRSRAVPDRRPLTVLCLRVVCDGMDEDDEDDAVERIAAELPRLSGHVTQAGGHADPVLAGTLVAWFGWPEAREEAARHAVDCALTARGPDTAVGIETGMAVCDPSGGLADLAGQVTRTALDLAGRAPAGQAWMGSGTDDATQGWFRRTAVADDAFRIERQSGADSRLEARPSPAPLLGRAAETARLDAVWRAAQEGGHAAVLVRGPAGIGKSRLVAELAATARHVFIARCRHERAHTPFLPIMTLLSEALALPDGRDRDARPAIARRFPTLSEPDRRRLAAFLDGPEAASLPPTPAAREALIDSLARAIAALPSTRPLLLWIEDVHWADPSTLATLARLIALAPPRLCLIVTARPAFQPAWPIETIELAGLPPETSLELATRLAGTDLPADRLRTLLARAEGVPLFIESLVHAARRGDTGIPATLNELLAARLDSVGDALGTAQLAATAGRRFGLDLLERAAQNDPRTGHHLERLLENGLIRREDEPASLAFGHALFQEAAYRSMPAATRRAHHAAIGDALLAGTPDLAEREPALLAWHYAGAERHDEACRYAIAAARLAAARQAPGEALQHLDDALAHVGRLPAGPARDAIELDIRLRQGSLLAVRHGIGSQEARAAYDRALSLAGPANDTPDSFPLLWGLWLGSSSWADHDVSLDLAHRLKRLAPLRTGDPFAHGHAHYALGNSLLSRGEFAAAAATLEAGLDGHPTDTNLSPYGEDAAVTNLAMLSWARWFLGRNDAALDAANRAVERARSLEHPYTTGYALILSAILHRLMGNAAAVRRYAEEAHRLSHEHDLALWIAASQAMLGWARAAAGDPAGLAELLDSANRVKDIAGGIETMFLAQLVDACERLGTWSQALEAAELGLSIGQAKRDRHYEAEFLRIKALAIAASGGRDASDLLRQADQVAREQGAVALSRRIAASAARLSSTGQQSVGLG
ncbi:MAG: AAA family ATPase [Chromatiales bacterium]|nr:AAA family ATPase [Chromatiales bacterium]